MKKNFCSYQAARLTLIVAMLTLLASCIDTSVDYGNIDTTAGWRVDDLKVPLGSTERVYVAQMLKEGEHVKTDSTNTYYLVERGKTTLRFDVPTLQTTFDVNRFNLSADFGQTLWNAFTAQLTPAQRAQLATTGLPLAAHYPNTYTAFDTQADFNLSFDWNKVFKALSHVALDNATLHVRLVLDESARELFRIYGVRDLRLELPGYLQSPQLTAGVYSPKAIELAGGASMVELGAIQVNALHFNTPMTREKFSAGQLRVSGKINVSTHKATTLRTAPKAGVRLELLLGNATQGTIAVREVEGVFEPEIAATRIAVPLRTAMPKFIDGVDATLDIERPTVRLDLDMQQIEADFSLNRLEVESRAPEGATQMVLTQAPIVVERRKRNTVYFHHGNSPYDPDGLVAGATHTSVPDIVQLVRRIPNELVFALDHKAVNVLPLVSRFRPGQTLVAELGYNLFVPLVFNTDFAISYKRKSAVIEVEQLDFTARDMKLTLQGEIESTIPLGLEVQAVALDKDGQAISEIKTPTVSVAAGSLDAPRITPLAIAIEVENSKAVERIHTIDFRIVSPSQQGSAGRALRSDQYIQLRQARLSVSGRVETAL